MLNLASRLSKKYRSLSARRAWIEILLARCTVSLTLSLSARRAWIEMMEHKHGGDDP